MRFRLRTLMILMAVLPPLLAGGYWAYGEWRMSMVHLEIDFDPNGGEVMRYIERPSGRVLAEYPVGHVSFDDDR